MLNKCTIVFSSGRGNSSEGVREEVCMGRSGVVFGILRGDVWLGSGKYYLDRTIQNHMVSNIMNIIEIVEIIALNQYF